MIARDTFLFVLLFSYLLGSLPTYRLSCLMFRKESAYSLWEFPGIKEHYPEFISNIIKGMAAVLISRILIGTPMAQVIAGLTVIAGHYWPAFFRLPNRTGFGVVIGVLAVFAPTVIPILILTWGISFLLFKKPYLSHTLSVMALPVSLWQIKRYDLYIVFGLIVAFFVSYQLLGQYPRKIAIRRFALVLIFGSMITMGLFSRYVYHGFGV